MVTLGVAVLSELLVGTPTGASMLVIRPFLRDEPATRTSRAPGAVLFILAVANAGGMLTPLGDPPLLVGYLGGVPFFWTLRLLPAWLLYVGSFAAALYFVDRRAYAREPVAAIVRDRAEVVPLKVNGRRNVALMLAIVPAALLPLGYREVAMVAIATASLLLTPRALHEANGFSFAPILEVALVFAGLFASLGPIEWALATHASSLPIQKGWQLFWASGLLSSVLDNAPTYTAFAARSRRLTSAPGSALVAGIAPCKLGGGEPRDGRDGRDHVHRRNGPNLMVKALADRERFPTPSFVRYALFAFIVMLPAHLLTTAVLVFLDR